MLKKLLKYEFVACSRRLFPLYGAVIVLSFCMRMAIYGDDFSWFDRISSILFFSVCSAVAVMTLLIVIFRFSRNVLGEEGYLTMTLPVKTSSIIWAKLIAAVVFVLLGCILATIAVMIIASSTDILFSRAFWSSMFDAVQEIFAYATVEEWIALALILLAGLLGLVDTILSVYLSASIGQLPFANAHRNLAGFVTFILLGIVLSNGSSMILTPLFFTLSSDTAGVSELNSFLIAADALSLAVAVGLFWGTNYILKNKLNLQ